MISGLLFVESDRAELERFIDISVFRPMLYSEIEYAGAYIFKSCIICEIKDRYTDKPREKSRFVV